MKYVLLIILALNIVGCASTDEHSCTWHQVDGNNGHWYDVCLPKDKKI